MNRNMRLRIMYLSVCMVLLFGCATNSSGRSNHIEFMEIPIDGDVWTFGDKLVHKGYSFYAEDTTYQQLIYYGSYLNKQATIRLDYDESSKNIISARVIFNEDIPNVTALINEYTEKYGKCEIESDGMSVYYSWKVNGGRLVINTVSSPILAIEYYKE